MLLGWNFLEQGKVTEVKLFIYPLLCLTLIMFFIEPKIDVIFWWIMKKKIVNEMKSKKR